MSPQKLGIAIPALNEEDSIVSIIERTLSAREYIIANSPVTDVEITVVSDGSTDRTVERASRFGDQIRLIVFPQNKGYGAAIKTAWIQSDADLLAFLDADGTCEPKFFAILCSVLLEKNFDVVLGCRLNKTSQMPLLRRFGNFLFATLLTYLSKEKVKDTASGMRVVRRGILDHLMPLPDGLHFTPAMSARAMMSGVLKIGEVDMPYQERVGESKLRVIKDGLRFLRVILTTAFLYRPSRPTALFGVLCGLGASLIMLSPTVFYFNHHAVQEWMIYRFLVAHLLGTGAVLSFGAAHICEQVTQIALVEELDPNVRSLGRQFFSSPAWILVLALLVGTGGILVIGSFLEWWQTGKTYEHWSRYVVMNFCLSTAMVIGLTKGVNQVLLLIHGRVTYWRGVRAETSQQALSSDRMTARLRALGNQQVPE